jgi:hypothetical protein
MNQKIKNLTGLRFGSLVVTGLSGKSEDGGTLWQVMCDCGKSAIKRQNNLVRKIRPTQTCGYTCPLFVSTYRTSTKKHPLYEMWAGMVARCNNPNATNFKAYGARGIQVCERWRSFENFLSDMGRRPTLKHTLERIDNGKGYEPDNCKWATRRENAFNKRNNRMTLEQADTYIANGLCKATVMDRIYKGWSVEAAVSTPAKKQRTTLQQ